MACHIVKDPKWGNVFMCGPTPRKQKCAHCGCPDAKALCDWPIMQPVPIAPPGTLAIGVAALGVVLLFAALKRTDA